MKKYLALFILFYCLFKSAAQDLSLSFRNIGLNEGLSQSSVVDIAVDQTGFLWFATQDGLNRYDGKDFLVFSKNFDDVTTRSGNRLGKIIVGNDNDLWLITSGGKLERLNLYNHTFQLWNRITKDSIPLPPINCLLAKNDQLWMGTDNEGLIVYNHGNNKMIRYTIQNNSLLTLSDNRIKSIFTDSKNRYWILTANGVTFFDPASNHSKKILDHQHADDPSAISFSAIDEDEEETIWLGSFGKGLFRKKNPDTTFIPFTGFNGSVNIPSDLVIESITEDREGKIWIGTYGKGLYVINTKTSTIQHFLSDKKNPFSIGYNDVLCIRKDKNGGIWMGTDGGGVSYYHNSLNNFFTYSNTNLPASISIEQVRSVVKDKKGRIWAGTSNQGLTFIDPVNNVYDQLHFPPYTKGNEIPERIVSLMCDEEGDIWVGTQGNGLIILDPNTKKIKKWLHPAGSKSLYIPDHTIWCMLPFKNGAILTGTQNAGLCLINTYTGIVSNAGLPAAEINSPLEKNVRAIIKMNDSSFCIGYEREGIKFFDVKNDSIFAGKDQPLQKIWPQQTILKCIFYQPPFLLAGTLGNGLMVYHLTTQKTDWITEANGLPNNTIYGIIEDKMGYLWLSSNKGIFRFRLPENPSVINRSLFTVFSATDGLQSNEFNTGAWYAGNDGTIFFGGIKGLNFFDPAHIVNTSLDIPVVITQATINNVPFNGDTIISAKKTLQLKYYQNSIAFNFAALDFLSGSGLNYSYRLLGYEEEWIDVGNRNYAAYTNLSPGNYLFEVKAFNLANKGNSPVTQLSIKITPPYWKTWWFILSGILLFLAILYSLYRYRVTQLLQMQNVRSRIATDLHDDIGSTLTNINILSELSKKNIDHKKEAEMFLNRITEEATTSSQALDDIVWSINKDNDTIDQTVARMRRYASEIFEAANISYSLLSDEQVAGRKLNMEMRRDFYLLFKEAVNNIYKHAKATHVEINVWTEKKNLYLQIRDDGKGFDTAAPTHRNGIKGMNTRIEKLKGHINIESESGKGTLIKISLPVS